MNKNIRNSLAFSFNPRLNYIFGHIFFLQKLNHGFSVAIIIVIIFIHLRHIRNHIYIVGSTNLISSLKFSRLKKCRRALKGDEPI